MTNFQTRTHPATVTEHAAIVLRLHNAPESPIHSQCLDDWEELPRDLRTRAAGAARVLGAAEPSPRRLSLAEGIPARQIAAVQST